MSKLAELVRRESVHYGKPKNDKRAITVYVNDEQKSALVSIAERWGISVTKATTEIMHAAIEEIMDAQKAAKP